MLIKLEDVVDLPTEPYHPQRIQQLAVQCKAQRCYESQSRQLKNEGEKIFPRFARTDGRYPHCLRQWPYYSKNASYGPGPAGSRQWLARDRANAEMFMCVHYL